MAETTTYDDPSNLPLIVSPTPYHLFILLAFLLALIVFILHQHKTLPRLNINSAVVIRELAATWSCIRAILLISWLVCLLIVGLITHLFEMTTGLRRMRERQKRLEERTLLLEGQAKDLEAMGKEIRRLGNVLRETQEKAAFFDMAFERAQREFGDGVERRRGRGGVYRVVL